MFTRVCVFAATTAFAALVLLAAAAAGVCSLLIGGGIGGSGDSNGGILNVSAGGRSIVTCQIDGGIHGEGLDLDAEQASDAAVISRVAASLGIQPQPRAVVIALATALQESSLRNLDYGTYDSLGLFQQRPTQGWGSPAQIMNPAYAAWQFYTHLVRVPDWWEQPIWASAQAVQGSAYPTAYQAQVVEATALQQFLAGAPTNCSD
jgi:hypothetical protein